MGLLLTLLVCTPPEPPGVQVERLPNGMQVVIAEDHALPLAGVQLWYRVGSGDDPAAFPGLGVLVRTLLDQRGDIALRLRAAGLRHESFTLPDACGFATRVPPSMLVEVLRTESIRAAPLAFGDHDLERAVAAVARGLFEHADDHETRRRLLAALFPEHPYQHPPGFVAASLEKVDRRAVEDFMQRWFVPANATLIVYGDVQPPAVLEHVRSLFEPLAWSGSAERTPRAGLADDIVWHAPVPAEQDALHIAWLAPAAGSFSSVSLDVLMHRLCNGVDGPLHRRLAERGLSPHWSLESWRHAGALVLTIRPERSRMAAVAPSLDFAAAATLVREVLLDAAQAPPGEIELNRARAMALREAAEQIADFDDRAAAVGYAEVVARNPMWPWQALDTIRAVQAGDLREAAAYLLSARSVYLPVVAATDVRDPRGPPTSGAQSELMPPPAAQPPRWVDATSARSRKGGPPAPPPATGAGVARDLDIVTRDNIVVCRVPGLPTACVCAVCPAEGPPPGLLHAAIAIGSRHRSATALEDYLTYNGVRLEPFREAGFEGFIAWGSADKSAQMFELQLELLHARCTEARALRAGHARLQQCWRQLADDHALLADVVACSLKTPDDAERVDLGLPALERLAEQLDRRAERVVVVGDVDVEAVLEEISTLRRELPAPADAERLTTARPTATQTTARPAVQFIWIPGFDAEAPALRLVVFDGADRPRLDESLAIGWRFGPPRGYVAELEPGVRWRWQTELLGGEPAGVLVRPCEPFDDLKREVADLRECAMNSTGPARELAAARAALTAASMWGGARDIAVGIRRGLIPYSARTNEPAARAASALEPVDHEDRVLHLVFVIVGGSEDAVRAAAGSDPLHRVAFTAPAVTASP